MPFDRLVRYVVPIVNSFWYVESGGADGHTAFGSTGLPVDFVPPAQVTLSVADGATDSAVISHPLPNAHPRPDYGFAIGHPDYFDVAVRINTNNTDDANGEFWLGAGTSKSACAIVRLKGDGHLELGYIYATLYAGLTSAVAGPNHSQRTGGRLWLRIVRSPFAIAAYWGIGATANACPDTWFCVGVTSDVTALTVSHGHTVRLNALTAAGVTGGWSVVVHDIASAGGASQATTIPDSPDE